MFARNLRATSSIFRAGRSIKFELPRYTAAPFHTSLPLFNSNEKIDPYKVLGILETATDEEIRKQYRKLAKEFHPDVCKLPDAQQRFLEVQKAYNMIKDEESREKSKIHTEFGNEMEGVDLDQIPKEEREVIVSVLQRIKDKKSILEGLTCTVAFEISALRNQGSEFLMTAGSVTEKLPQYVSMTCNEIFENSDDKLKFSLFSRMEDQNAIGHIVYNQRDQKMEFNSRDEKLIATAKLNSSSQSGMKKVESFMVRSLGKVVGVISFSYFPMFPFMTSLRIILPNEKAPPIYGNRFNFFGSRSIWGSKNIGILTSAKREFFAPFGRIFDVDILTHHQDVHPALYLFSVAYIHSIERKHAFFRPILSGIAKKLQKEAIKQEEEKNEK